MRILIVKLSSIGDVVHTLPAVALLKRSITGAHISWIVDRRASAILIDTPAIDRLIEIDTRAWKKNGFGKKTLTDIRSALGQARGSINSSKSDEDSRPFIAIDCQGLIKSGLIAYASRARHRIGFETPELREQASRLFLTRQVSTSNCRHVIDKNISLAKQALAICNVQDNQQSAVQHAGYEFPIEVSNQDEQYIDELISPFQDGFAIINPGGGWPTKLWPVERYGQLADQLYSEHGLASVVTYGPGEEGLAKAVLSNSRSGSVHVIKSSLKQFVALARRASIFIGGDTGPLHLAAASRTPIVGIYGPTSPDRNGPFDSRDVVVGRDLWCRDDCHRRSCWHWQCMDIPLSAVTAAVRLRLEKVRKAISNDASRTEQVSGFDINRS